MEKEKILIIGSGFSGAVVAHELAKSGKYSISVVDERDHIAGNCFTSRDTETGVMVHKYGPHIFHTSNKEIWEYVNRFVTFHPFVNRVKSVYKGKVYSLPINLHTINQFFETSMGPDEARKFIEKKGDQSIKEPKSFEEQALRFVGKELYDAFFYGYTKKQWGTHPKNLPASILKRLPVRFNYDDNYYNDIYQGIPENGYTEIIEKMLDHPDISITLNFKYKFNREDQKKYKHIFYTGPIDEFYDYQFGKLSYRTVYFERKVQLGDYQGNPVINYADEEIPYTRIHEHKHFTPWENHEKTVYFEEYSKETGDKDIPYYPKRLEADMNLYHSYLGLAEKENQISFVGRLATYRYMDMHNVIEEALDTARDFVKKSSI